MADREYLPRLPASLPEDGRVLLHNHVLRPTRRLGSHGFRAWLQQSNDALEVCDCGFARELGQHFRVRPHEA
jgi:hypothetical protein